MSLRIVTLSALILILALCDSRAWAAHPLDPLDAHEFDSVKSILEKSRRFASDCEFVWIQLVEPPKATVKLFKDGADFPRKASADAIDYRNGKTYRAVVDLRKAEIESVTNLGSLQPGLTDRDLKIARETIDADPKIRDALIKRGFKIDGPVSRSVRLELMSIGIDPSLEGSGARLIRVLFAADRTAAGDTGPYLSGLMAVIDLFSRRIIRFHNRADASPQVPQDVFVPRGDVSGSAPGLVISQPQGRGFVIADNVVKWNGWSFRYGFNTREGLVLYQIALDDGRQTRSVAYRASLSEILTSYGDPSDMWSWMQIFDEGALGLGNLSIEVEPGQLVPSNAVMINPPELKQSTAAKFGEMPKNRIYIFERDGGNRFYLYSQDGRTLHARATELVIGFFASLGNYTYGFNWVFKQDGSFAFDVELAGTILTKIVAAQGCDACVDAAHPAGSKRETRTNEPKGADRHGGFVYPHVVGINHQHWFNIRLDFDVDGEKNAAMESNVRSQANQRGRATEHPAFTVAQTVFGTAIEAKRLINHDTSRTWTIFNPASVDREGYPRGYRVVPNHNALTTFPKSRERGSASFTFHHFWITPYREGQLYASGAYPYQAGSDTKDTLYSYADGSPVYDQDIVLWYSLGSTHIPRPEDFPLMTNMILSVQFQPVRFFDRNPSLGPTKQ